MWCFVFITRTQSVGKAQIKDTVSAIKIMSKKKNFAKLQQALFARSAKMMSYELRTHREEWGIEHDYVTTKARRQHRKVYRRTCNYVFHSCYNELLVELQMMLAR